MKSNMVTPPLDVRRKVGEPTRSPWTFSGFEESGGDSGMHEGNVCEVVLHCLGPDCRLNCPCSFFFNKSVYRSIAR